MEEKYFYSALTGGFYLSSIHEVIPEDKVQIAQKEYTALLSGQEKGKVIQADENGKPVLVDPPELTPEQLALQAEAKRSDLMADATIAINPLQDAVDLDEATTDEIEQLKIWKSYRVALNRLDLSKAPNIAWPQIPKQDK